MKLMIVYGEPMKKENNHYLFCTTKEILKQKGYSEIDVDIQALKCKTADIRKYGRLGWFYIQYLQFMNAYHAVKRTNDGDIILSQDFGTGRLCSFISVIKNKKRKIVALNCLQRRIGKSFTRFLEKKIDLIAWKNEYMITTVNTQNDIQYLAMPEYRKNKIYVMPDCFTPYEPVKRKIKYDCMTGGYANRDFHSFFEAAKQRPQYRFCCIVGSYFDDTEYSIPSNVLIYRDVKESDFFKIMQESRIVCMPLKENVASGLVVVKNAISFEIPILASNTFALANYVPDNMKDLFLFERGNIQDYIDKMDRLLNVTEGEVKEKMQEVKRYCVKNYGKESTCRFLVEIMEDSKFF